ncbi:RES family NAD+ phosphorylase [Pararhizobium sp. LjRoot238]|uniref:RES family NAD+ phosphorylase n=1 Tax=Pararhizobium sp. LjRoot238 TaxID=3342293 RepID=UPI003ECE9735
MGKAKTRQASTADVPAPPNDLPKSVKVMIWPKGQFIHRIHLNLYRGAQFNPGARGNARFSPIKDAMGASVPTLYGGTTFDCAAMETVFHDVPFAAGLKTYDRQKLTGQVYSQVAPQRDFALADLRSTTLRKLGIQRNQLIDTEKDRYPDTRVWAEAIHAQCPDIEGLCWISRQDDRAQALVLFGDRVSAKDLVAQDDPIDILSDLDAYSVLLGLADRIGMNIVDGKA